MERTRRLGNRLCGRLVVGVEHPQDKAARVLNSLSPLSKSSANRSGSTTTAPVPGRMRYFGPGAIFTAFCSQGPGFRMSPDTLPAASLTKAIRV